MGVEPPQRPEGVPEVIDFAGRRAVCTPVVALGMRLERQDHLAAREAKWLDLRDGMPGDVRPCRQPLGDEAAVGFLAGLCSVLAEVMVPPVEPDHGLAGGLVGWWRR